MGDDVADTGAVVSVNVMSPTLATGPVAFAKRTPLTSKMSSDTTLASDANAGDTATTRADEWSTSSDKTGLPVAPPPPDDADDNEDDAGARLPLCQLPFMPNCTLPVAGSSFVRFAPLV